MTKPRPSLLVLALAGCSASSSPSPDAPPPLRPGVEDSSHGFKGTPSPNETAFWTAVREADDPARASAVDALKADVAADPANGYSAFLIGASHFMAPTATLVALATGTRPDAFMPSQAAAPYLAQGLANLTDPFYLGFDGALLAGLQFAAGDPNAMATGVTAFGNNRVATGFFLVIQDLAVKQDPHQAMLDGYGILDFCNGSPVDRTGADAASYVTKLNAGSLAQRECYSGYLAPHGSSGLMLLFGDVHALLGDPAAAHAYWTAAQGTSDYASWPLRPVVERRLAGAPASLGELTGIAATCGTCHTDRLP